MKEKMYEVIGSLASKMENNSVLQSISQGIMGVLPVIIVGAFASLFIGLPITGYQSFLETSGLKSALTALSNGTTNMLGIFFTFSVARTYAKRKEIENINIVSIFAVALYGMLLPTAVLEEGASALPFTYLGTQGMIIGILLAFLAVGLYKWVLDRHIVITMPEGTPSFVSNSFVALIPCFLIAVVGLALRMGFAATSFGNAFDFVYILLQAPLTNLVGNNIWSVVVISIIAGIVFSFGIHNGFVTGMIAPILFGLDAMNQGAYAAGQPLPNVIGMAFMYITTVAVLYPAMSVGTIVGAKSERLKTVGKLSFFPALFGISEPLLFGLPIVFNPIMMIPYIFLPVINLLIGYGAIVCGIVAPCSGVTVFNIPMIMTGLLNGSLSIVALEIGLFILDVLLFIPFVKMQERFNTDEERIADQESDREQYHEISTSQA